MLLGCGQAGKSTFIKQMRIIHSEGFQDDEKEQIKLDIASNIAHSITCLIENSVFDETLETDEGKKLQAAIDNITSTFDKHFDINTQLYAPDTQVVLEMADEISFVWKSAPIQQAYSNRNNFQLIDCAKYFLNKIHEIMAPDYMPNNDDITQTRVKTEGIIEHEFQIQGNGPARGKIIMVRHSMSHNTL